MKVAGINKNDAVNGKGYSVSLFLQGCPHRCKGCFNSDTWDFDGGQVINNSDVIEEIIEAIQDNGIIRNFSVLGGEPLCPENRADVAELVAAIRQSFPEIAIYTWTGYLFEDLKDENDKDLESIFDNIDILIDGPYKEDERDITLPLRGSRNQRIIQMN